MAKITGTVAFKTEDKTKANNKMICMQKLTSHIYQPTVSRPVDTSPCISGPDGYEEASLGNLSPRFAGKKPYKTGGRMGGIPQKRAALFMHVQTTFLCSAGQTN